MPDGGFLVPNCEVGIKEILKDNELAIYPNPALDKITINLAGLHLDIYNIQGQIVFQQDLTQRNTEIDISLLPEGIYFAKVGFVDGGYMQKKFVVIK
jgi:hypothetical protein